MKGKRYIYTGIFSLFLLFGLCSIAFAAQTETFVNVSPPTQTVSPGQSFTINITISPHVPIAGAQFDLHFDSSLVSASSVTEGSLLKGGGKYNTYFSPGAIDNNAGTITGVAGAIITPGGEVSSNGTFATIQMTAKSATGTSALDLKNVFVGDINGSDVQPKENNGTVTVGLFATVEITPLTQTVEQGSPFTVNVTVFPNPEVPIAGVQFDLSFNHHLVSVSSVTEGNLLKGENESEYKTYFSSGAIDKDAGTITGVAGAIITAGGNVSTPGVFATIQMVAKSVDGTSTLNLSNVVVGDINGSSVPIMINDGIVTIGESTTVNIIPQTQPVPPGSAFTVNVSVDPKVPIASVQFDLSFNSSLISAINVTEGDLLRQGGAVPDFSNGTIDNGAGTITGVWGEIEPPGGTVSSEGVFARINMTANTIDWDSLLDLSNITVGDIDGNQVPIWINDGEIRVNYPPVASFSCPLEAFVNQTVTFDASDSYDPHVHSYGYITSYKWEFGDGNVMTTSEKITTYAYDSAGIYTINLTVTDDDGVIDEITRSIKISPRGEGVVACFSYSPAYPFVNQTVTFDASCSSDPLGHIANYKWEFGDGNIANTSGKKITHTYNSAGNYIVNLTLTDDGDGVVNKTTRSIKISQGIYVDDGFEDDPANHTWDSIQEGVDDAIDYICNEIIVYDGNYTENVKVNKSGLTIRSENGTDKTIVRAKNSDDHVFEVTASNVTISGFTVENATGYDKSGIYLDSVEHCNISDNNESNNSVGIYLLHSPGNNKIANNEANSNDRGGIIVSCNSSNNTLANNKANSNGVVGIYLHSSSDNIITNNNVNSNLGCGFFLGRYSSGNEIKNNTAKSNDYGIYMDTSSENKIYSNNFIDNNIKNAYSSFSNNLWNSSSQMQYVYNGHTYTNYTGNYWSDYPGNDTNGDGIGDTAYSINSDDDNYPLMVFWENYFPGGKQPPVASFTYSPENPVVNQPVTFNASSSYGANSTIISYDWDIGDGNNATGKIVTHSYSSEGNYTVKLTVTDNFSLTNSTTKEIVIRENIPNITRNMTISAINQLEPVVVGMHPNASDGYDEYDVFAQTPVQEKVTLILDAIYSTSIKRTRYYNESVSWNMSVGVPTGQTTNLSWSVPSNVNLTIYEGNNTLYSGVELSEGSHELLVTAKLIESIRFSLKLKSGWNMVSLPLVPDNCSVDAIFGNISTLATMPVVTWESPSFVNIEEVEPKIGYWVFTPANTTINVTGKPSTNTTLILKAGWNMVGTVGMDNLTISDIPNQVLPAVTWVAPSFVETDIIEPGKSAWVFVTTDTIVTAGKAVSTRVKARAVPAITKIKSEITPAAAITNEWNLTISATNPLEPVTLGIHPSATNGYDEFDVFARTPVQEKVIMILDDIYATEINKDKLSWIFSVGVPNGETTTLTWDPSKVPADITLTLDGTDMKLHSSMELGEGSHLFVINGSTGEPTAVFDTGKPANPYPSIFGTHTGKIIPNQRIAVHKLYTYPCPGTGGHTEYVKIWKGSWTVTRNWNGYIGDWHNITFSEPFTLEQGEEYNYEIKTGSYPEIIHESSKNVTGGSITCTEFRGANGNLYTDWIPAIRLW